MYGERNGFSVNMQNDDLKGLCPVESYEPPRLPSLNEGRKDPVLLKKLPARWQNKTRVLACIGLLSANMLSLTACPIEELFDDRSHHGGAGGIPVYVDGETEQDNTDSVPSPIITENLELRAHYGGSGAGPFYVIYITEQEALSVIRFMLETAGLRLDATPPQTTVEVVTDNFLMLTTDFGIDLFDDEKGVAVVLAGASRYIAEEIANEFEKLDTRFTVGVFYSPRLSPDDDLGYKWNMHNYSDDHTEPTDDEIEEAKVRARPILEEQLNAQIQYFINFLISEGILEQ